MLRHCTCFFCSKIQHNNKYNSERLKIIKIDVQDKVKFHGEAYLTCDFIQLKFTV
jgi:hypothetical protein